MSSIISNSKLDNFNILLLLLYQKYFIDYLKIFFQTDVSILKRILSYDPDWLQSNL